MNKLSTFILVACMAGAGVMTAQVPKTVHVLEAGTLSTLLSETEKATVTDLTVTGNINRADIYFIGSLAKGSETELLPRNMTGVLVNIDFSEAVVLGDSIPEGAFEERMNLGKVAVPNSIKVIGKKAFYNIGFDTVDAFDFQYPTGLKEICSQAFHDSYYFDNFDLPEGLEIIGSQAFQNTSMYKPVKITIPSTVTSIGSMAFNNQNGSSLPGKVYNCGRDPLYIETYESPLWGTTMTSYVFSETTLAVCTLYVPKASIDAYKEAAVWKDFSAIEAIEDANALPAVKTTEPVYGYIANNALTVKGLTGTAAVTLTGLNGKTLLRKTVSSGVSIPLNGLSKGVYVVRIGDKTNKIIINH